MLVIQPPEEKTRTPKCPRSVTICIAGFTATRGDYERLVTVSDTKLSWEGKAITTRVGKVSGIARSWVGLYTGNSSQATTVYLDLIQRFMGKPSPTVSQIERAVVQAFRNRRSGAPKNLQFLVGGWDGKTGARHLFTVYDKAHDSKPKVEYFSEGFYAIGSACEVAHTILVGLYDQDAWGPWEVAVRLCEAKFWCDKDPYVGPDTYVYAIDEQHNSWHMMPSETAKLKRVWQRRNSLGKVATNIVKKAMQRTLERFPKTGNIWETKPPALTSKAPQSQRPTTRGLLRLPP